MASATLCQVDDDFARAQASAARRVQIMRNVGAAPRAADAYLIEEPHEHSDAHCCPFPGHGHHVTPHRMCALR